MTASAAAEFTEGWSDLLEQSPGALDNVRDPVGLPTTTVEEVVQADDSCVVARVDRTHADVYVENEPAAGMQAWVVLERVPDDEPEAAYAAEHNPTPWRYAVVDVYTHSETPDAAWCRPSAATGSGNANAHAVPDEIDPAYVDGVLAELEASLAEAMTVDSRKKSFDDPAASEQLAAIMTPEGAETHLALTDLLVQQSGWEVFADPVGCPTPPSSRSCRPTSTV